MFLHLQSRAGLVLKIKICFDLHNKQPRMSVHSPPTLETDWQQSCDIPSQVSFEISLQDVSSRIPARTSLDILSIVLFQMKKHTSTASHNSMASLVSVNCPMPCWTAWRQNTSVHEVVCLQCVCIQLDLTTLPKPNEVRSGVSKTISTCDCMCASCNCLV